MKIQEIIKEDEADDEAVKVNKRPSQIINTKEKNNIELAKKTMSIIIRGKKPIYGVNDKRLSRKRFHQISKSKIKKIKNENTKKNINSLNNADDAPNNENIKERAKLVENDFKIKEKELLRNKNNLLQAKQIIRRKSRNKHKLQGKKKVKSLEGNSITDNSYIQMDSSLDSSCLEEEQEKSLEEVSESDNEENRPFSKPKSEKKKQFKIFRPKKIKKEPTNQEKLKQLKLKAKEYAQKVKSLEDQKSKQKPEAATKENEKSGCNKYYFDKLNKYVRSDKYKGFVKILEKYFNIEKRPLNIQIIEKILKDLYHKKCIVDYTEFYQQIKDINKKLKDNNNCNNTGDNILGEKNINKENNSQITTDTNISSTVHINQENKFMKNNLVIKKSSQPKLSSEAYKEDRYNYLLKSDKQFFNYPKADAYSNRSPDKKGSVSPSRAKASLEQFKSSKFEPLASSTVNRVRNFNENFFSAIEMSENFYEEQEEQEDTGVFIDDFFIGKIKENLKQTLKSTKEIILQSGKIRKNVIKNKESTKYSFVLNSDANVLSSYKPKNMRNASSVIKYGYNATNTQACEPERFTSLRRIKPQKHKYSSLEKIDFLKHQKYLNFYKENLEKKQNKDLNNRKLIASFDYIKTDDIFHNNNFNKYLQNDNSEGNKKYNTNISNSNSNSNDYVQKIKNINIEITPEYSKLKENSCIPFSTTNKNNVGFSFIDGSISKIQAIKNNILNDVSYKDAKNIAGFETSNNGFKEQFVCFTTESNRKNRYDNKLGKKPLEYHSKSNKPEKPIKSSSLTIYDNIIKNQIDKQDYLAISTIKPEESASFQSNFATNNIGKENNIIKVIKMNKLSQDFNEDENNKINTNMKLNGESNYKIAKTKPNSKKPLNILNLKKTEIYNKSVSEQSNTNNFNINKILDFKVASAQFIECNQQNSLNEAKNFKQQKNLVNSSYMEAKATDTSNFKLTEDNNFTRSSFSNLDKDSVILDPSVINKKKFKDEIFENFKQYSPSNFNSFNIDIDKRIVLNENVFECSHCNSGKKLTNRVNSISKQLSADKRCEESQDYQNILDKLGIFTNEKTQMQKIHLDKSIGKDLPDSKIINNTNICITLQNKNYFIEKINTSTTNSIDSISIIGKKGSNSVLSHEANNFQILNSNSINYNNKNSAENSQIINQALGNWNESKSNIDKQNNEIYKSFLINNKKLRKNSLADISSNSNSLQGQQITDQTILNNSKIHPENFYKNFPQSNKINSSIEEKDYQEYCQNVSNTLPNNFENFLANALLSNYTSAKKKKGAVIITKNKSNASKSKNCNLKKNTGSAAISSEINNNINKINYTSANFDKNSSHKKQALFAITTNSNKNVNTNNILVDQETLKIIRSDKKNLNTIIMNYLAESNTCFYFKNEKFKCVKDLTSYEIEITKVGNVENNKNLNIKFFFIKGNKFIFSKDCNKLIELIFTK